MKFPLVISLLFFLIAIPTMDSKRSKRASLNEEGSDNFHSIVAHDEFRPPMGKRFADINFNSMEDQNDKFRPPYAGINSETIEDQDKFIAPPGKRSAGIDFNTVEDQDTFGFPPGTHSAGINFNTVEDQDKFVLPLQGKRSAGMDFNTMEDQDKFRVPNAGIPPRPSGKRK